MCFHLNYHHGHIQKNTFLYKLNFPTFLIGRIIISSKRSLFIWMNFSEVLELRRKWFDKGLENRFDFGTNFSILWLKPKTHRKGISGNTYFVPFLKMSGENVLFEFFEFRAEIRTGNRLVLGKLTLQCCQGSNPIKIFQPQFTLR